MRPFEELASGYRISGIRTISTRFMIFGGTVEFFTGLKATVIFGYKEADGKMEHVSVAPVNSRHICTWDEMCFIKDLFFRPEEMVVQIHPAEDRYFHGFDKAKNVLHLWRPADGDFSILNHPEEWD